MPVMHPTVINAHAKLLTKILHRPGGLIFEGGLYLRGGLFSRSYSIPMCCLLLYMDCAHKQTFSQQCLSGPMVCFNSIVLFTLTHFWYLTCGANL